MAAYFQTTALRSVAAKSFPYQLAVFQATALRSKKLTSKPPLFAAKSFPYQLAVFQAMAASFQITPLRTVLVQNELHFRLYLHHTYAGPNRNQIGVVDAGTPNGFGNIVVNDWAIYDGPGPDAKIVARAQGQHVQSSMSSREWHNNFTIVFGDEGVIPHTVEIELGDEDEELNTVGDGAQAIPRFKGSTLQVMGTVIEKGEWAIVGGTGEFTMAHGVIYKTPKKIDANENIIQLDIHALYTPMKRSKVSGSADGNAWTLGV